MHEIVRDVFDWLPVLWRVGVERGEERLRVVLSLDFCRDALLRLRDSKHGCACACADRCSPTDACVQ